MAAPKTIRRKAGDKLTAADSDTQVPLNLADIAAAVTQLQNTVNALIVVFNAHVHTENTAGSYAQNASTGVSTTTVDGTPQSAANDFTAA